MENEPVKGDVLALIRKETPQKVNIHDVANISECRCPACHHLIQIPAEAILFDDYFYCWSCGQKLVIERVEENE